MTTVEAVVGERVTAKFNEDSGDIELFSDEGTLWPDWLERANIDRKHVRSISVKKGTVFLPANSSGYDSGRKKIQDVRQSGEHAHV